jgi:hypothetical protein
MTMHARAAASRGSGSAAASAALVARPFGGGCCSGIQPKLFVGSHDDPLERDADRVADAIVGGGARDRPGVAAAAPAAPIIIRRKCASCEEEDDDTLRGKDAGAEGPVTPNVADAIFASRQGGRPLSAAEHAFFAPRFGHRFDEVRVHDDERAASLSSSVRARAFTLGQDIFFGRGEYAPERSEGRHLMAHELAHVVQQTGEGGGVIRRQQAPGGPPVPASCPVSAVRRIFSRGNDDPSECQYETARIRVEVFADPCACNVLTRPIPLSMEYVVNMEGKSFADAARTIPDAGFTDRERGQAGRVGRRQRFGAPRPPNESARRRPGRHAVGADSSDADLLLPGQLRRRRGHGRDPGRRWPGRVHVPDHQLERVRRRQRRPGGRRLADGGAPVARPGGHAHRRITKVSQIPRRIARPRQLPVPPGHGRPDRAARAHLQPGRRRRLRSVAAMSIN